MQYYTEYTSPDSENHSNRGFDVEGCWSTGGADRYGQNMILGSDAINKQAQECHESHPEDEPYNNNGYDVEGCGSTAGPNKSKQDQTCGYAGLDLLRHKIITYEKNNPKQHTTPSGGGDGGATSRYLTRQLPQNRREYKRPDKNMSESRGGGSSGTTSSRTNYHTRRDYSSCTDYSGSGFDGKHSGRNNGEGHKGGWRRIGSNI